MINGKKYLTLIEINWDHEVSDVQRIKFFSSIMGYSLSTSKETFDKIRSQEIEFFLPMSSNMMVEYTAHGFKCTYCEFEEDQVNYSGMSAHMITPEQLDKDVFDHECSYEKLSEKERGVATTINMLMACASLEMKYYIGRKYNNYIRDFKD